MKRVFDKLKVIIPAAIVTAAVMVSVFPSNVFAACVIDVNRTYMEARDSEKFENLSGFGSYDPTHYEFYENNVHMFTGSTTKLTGGCYIVDGTVNVSGVITATGNNKIFLNKGAVLNAQKGIQIAGYRNGDSYYISQLDIYEEKTGTGTINVSSPDSGKAGIGGDDYFLLMVHSGTINAAGGKYAPGIGTNMNGSAAGGSYIETRAGTINCYGGAGGGAGIGSGKGGMMPTIKLMGGTINATGNGGAGIGYGLATRNLTGNHILMQRMTYGAESYMVWDSKLVVKAVGESGAYGVGGSKNGSYECKPEWINIISGDITLRGDGGAAGSCADIDSTGDVDKTNGTQPGYASEYLYWADIVNGTRENVCFLSEMKNEDVRAGGRRVVFDTRDANTVVPAQWVKEGEKVKAPSIKRGGGYKLKGWSENFEGELYDFSTAQGTEPWGSGRLTLYAQWEKDSSDSGYYYMQFVTNGGTEVATQRVKAGACATQPSTRKSGYNFKYWAERLDGGLVKYDFNTKMSYDEVLFAVWEYNGRPFGSSGMPNTDSTDARMAVALIFLLSAVGAGVSLKLRKS